MFSNPRRYYQRILGTEYNAKNICQGWIEIYAYLIQKETWKSTICKTAICLCDVVFHTLPKGLPDRAMTVSINDKKISA